MFIIVKPISKLITQFETINLTLEMNYLNKNKRGKVSFRESNYENPSKKAITCWEIRCDLALVLPNRPMEILETEEFSSTPVITNNDLSIGPSEASS